MQTKLNQLFVTLSAPTCWVLSYAYLWVLQSRGRISLLWSCTAPKNLSCPPQPRDNCSKNNITHPNVASSINTTSKNAFCHWHLKIWVTREGGFPVQPKILSSSEQPTLDHLLPSEAWPSISSMRFHLQAGEQIKVPQREEEHRTMKQRQRKYFQPIQQCPQP